MNLEFTLHELCNYIIRNYYMNQFNNYVISKGIKSKMESELGEDVLGDILQLNFKSPQVHWFIIKNFPNNLKKINHIESSISVYEENLPVYLELYELMFGKKELNFENFMECIDKFTFLGNSDKKYLIIVAHKIQFGEEPSEELLKKYSIRHDMFYEFSEDEGESV